MKRVLILLAMLFVMACGEPMTRTVIVKQPSSETENKVKELEKQMAALSLFAGSFTSTELGPFKDCASLTVVLDKKVCTIAQSFTATSQAELKTQLAIMAKEFQNALFGTDCVNSTEAGCPIDGSVSDKITDIQADLVAKTTSISNLEADMLTVQGTLSSLTTRVSTLESRLDNFKGSGKTAEVLVGEIQSDVSALKVDVAAIKGDLASNQAVDQYTICGDNAASGPIYEVMLLSGDRVNAFAYMKVGTADGLGLLFKAGDTNLFKTTYLNSKSCNYKMYNNVGNTKVQACWVSTNRSANQATIDAARTAGTATCTPF